MKDNRGASRSGTPGASGLAVLAVLAIVALCSGCFATIEQVNPATGQPVWSQPGRAYFVKKRLGSSKVIACDAQPTSVSCFETDREGPPAPR